MPSCSPTLDPVRALAGRCGAVPIVRRLPGDQLTPVAAFSRLSAGARRAFLLESVIGGERLGRFSFAGADPGMVLRARGTQAVIEGEGIRSDEMRATLTGVASGTPSHTDEGQSALRIDGISDPLALLERLLSARRVIRRADIPRGPAAWPRFTGGAVGYAGYDAVRYYERLPAAPQDDRGLDDLDFGIYDDLVAFDHVNNTILVIAHARLSGGDVRDAYDDAVARIERMVARLHEAAPRPVNPFDLDADSERPCSSTFQRADFETAVRRAKAYIEAGDVFQVVLSQRLRTETTADPFDVYRALRMVNPSPFMFYLRRPGCILAGASPEILCRVEDGVVTNRPLAGTRRRGATPEEDARLEAELLGDAKDRAEHIMLVDLGRNDVGRVAAAGTVRLDELMTVERYSHVMHISSQVTGRLAAGRTACDALRTALPAGTVSGAPKVRALEIIDEVEPVRRGPYGGAAGYFDFEGNMDTCIALRTMVLTPMQADHPVAAAGPAWNVDIQAGAGIVADSDPAAEYEETLNKAKAMLTAVNMAEGGRAGRPDG